MTTDRADVAAVPEGDLAILERLQERMERIIRGESPNAGRFCGYCYARLERDDGRCSVCGRTTAETPPVERVPREALRVYNAYRGKMQLWVNTFAFAGIFLSIVLCGLIIVYLPNPWKFIVVVVTVLAGSWYFANLFAGFGALLGMRRGAPIRAARWRELLQRRAAGENLDAR